MPTVHNILIIITINKHLVSFHILFQLYYNNFVVSYDNLAICVSNLLLKSDQQSYIIEKKLVSTWHFLKKHVPTFFMNENFILKYELEDENVYVFEFMT